MTSRAKNAVDRYCFEEKADGCSVPVNFSPRWFEAARTDWTVSAGPPPPACWKM